MKQPNGGGLRDALGAFTLNRKQYGIMAAPTLIGRRGGPGVTPALQGLFRRGPAIGISQINAMATNVMRGSG